MRRIVHYYPDAIGNSGVTFALWSWARAQAASGAEVCVFYAPGHHASSHAPFVTKSESPLLTASPVEHRGGNRHTLRPIDLARHLGKNDLLVLHEGWVTSNLVAAAAARAAGVPYVVMPHGVYERQWTRYLKPPRFVRNYFERQMLEGAAAVHVFFESETADIRALAPRARFITVPTGYDVPSDEWQGGGGYIGWIGRIDPVHKGLDVLVAAMAQLRPADRPKLRICGYDYKGGAERLRDLIAAHNVADSVHLESPIAGEEKQKFLREADGYVHPSRWECHSIALLENLALGVPCLVSSAIHIAGTLAQSRAAVLAAPAERELSEALKGFGAARQGVAGRGRALIETAFNWDTLMPQFHAAVRQVA